MRTIRSGCGRRSGFSSTPWTTAKMAVFAAMAIAIVEIAATVNVRCFIHMRRAYRTSSHAVMGPWTGPHGRQLAPEPRAVVHPVGMRLGRVVAGQPTTGRGSDVRHVAEIRPGVCVFAETGQYSASPWSWRRVKRLQTRPFH